MLYCSLVRVGRRVDKLEGITGTDFNAGVLAKVHGLFIFACLLISVVLTQCQHACVVTSLQLLWGG